MQLSCVQPRGAGGSFLGHLGPGVLPAPPRCAENLRWALALEGVLPTGHAPQVRACFLFFVFFSSPLPRVL